MILLLVLNTVRLFNIFFFKFYSTFVGYSIMSDGIRENTITIPKIFFVKNYNMNYNWYNTKIFSEIHLFSCQVLYPIFSFKKRKIKLCISLAHRSNKNSKGYSAGSLRPPRTGLDWNHVFHKYKFNFDQKHAQMKETSPLLTKCTVRSVPRWCFWIAILNEWKKNLGNFIRRCRAKYC